MTETLPLGVQITEEPLSTSLTSRGWAFCSNPLFPLGWGHLRNSRNVHLFVVALASLEPKVWMQGLSQTYF